MAVEIKFFANFREIVGDKKASLDARDVGELLENLVDEHGGLKGEIFDEGDSEKVNDLVNILVNGRRIESLDGLDTELNDGDSVAIFPPVSGG